MEEAKVLKKAHSFHLSRYYGSAAFACMDALAFTSACNLADVEKSPGDENSKPRQQHQKESQTMKLKGKEGQSKQGQTEEKLPKLGEILKDEESSQPPPKPGQDAFLPAKVAPLTKSQEIQLISKPGHLSVQKDQDCVFMPPKQGQVAIQKDQDCVFMPSKQGQVVVQKDRDPIFMPLKAAQQLAQSKKDSLYMPLKGDPPVAQNKPSPSTTPPKCPKPSPSLLPLHYQPPTPCSVCGKPLQVGWPTRSLTYEELKAATNNFSRSNFISEGESSFVYKGVLNDGKQVAIKSVGRKTAKFQSEVRTLGSLQHPNIVSLVGFCDEAGKAMLVYDYICNGTLDWHLSARNPNVVPWSARRTIAVQVARGLQFLHECRLGCLLHRDIRAKNILLTHDYTAVIAGFGNARWVDAEEKEMQTSIQGRSHNASEDPASEKADVYAFGILLLELMSGRSMMNCSRMHEDQKPLIEWARPLLLEDSEVVVNRILDPRLSSQYKPYELFCMVNAASMCLRKDPATRPRMRLILGCLEDAKESPKGSPALVDYIQARTPPAAATAIHQTTASASNPAQQQHRGSAASTGCHTSNNKRREDRKKSSLRVTWKLPEHQGCMSKSSDRPQPPSKSKPKLLSYNDLH